MHPFSDELMPNAVGPHAQAWGPALSAVRFAFRSRCWTASLATRRLTQDHLVTVPSARNDERSGAA